MGSNRKVKMTTINAVYNRIIWDVRLDSRVFTIGYQERLSSEGIREKPVNEWDEDGDIPWHRVRYVRCGDTIVWDRQEHIDLFKSDKLPDIAWKQEPIIEKNQTAELVIPDGDAVSFNHRLVYRFVGDNWQSVGDLGFADIDLKHISAITFNILCGLYESDRIYTYLRLPAIIEHLRQSNADIMAIQEASPDFLELILAQDWVRQDYYVSEISPGKTIKPFGNFILSRYPFRLVDYRFFGHKRVLVGTWQINGQQLHAAVVHLTSDRGKNAPQKRRYQLSVLLRYLQGQVGNCLLMGDFNVRGDEQEDILRENGFVDVWPVLHPDEVGYTFDPQSNPLAALMSREGQPARFDRILLRSQNRDLIPQGINLFAKEAIPQMEDIYPSDHFGVGALFNWLGKEEKPEAKKQQKSLAKITPIYKTAIAIIPPEDIQPQIQAIRQQFDARFERWMPHINLIYGFLPESYFEEAVEMIAPVLAKLSPFRVTLAEYGTFNHRRSCTAWLRPIVEPEHALQELQATLERLFPQCNEQSRKSPAGFTPHLSVGQFPDCKTAMESLPPWKEVSFLVDRVAVISRQGNQPFTVKHLIRLGEDKQNSGFENVVNSDSNSQLLQLVNKLEPKLNPTQIQQRQTIQAIITQACRECLGFPPRLYLLGSARLGVESPDSDLDMVCLIPKYLPGEVFLATIQQHLQGLCDRTQLVLNAKVPLLRFLIDGVSCDLLYTCVDFDDLPANFDLSMVIHQNLDSTSRKAILGCLEADLIRELVTQHISWELFTDLLRTVKAWGKSRYIYGNSWGFLGGFSFTLLTAWTCITYRKTNQSHQTNLANLLHHFFHTLSQHNWQKSITLTNAGQEYTIELPQDILPIVTSIAPCQNSARNVTPSTAKVFQNELARGAEITAAILAETPDPKNQNQPNPWLKLFTFSHDHDDKQIEISLNIAITGNCQQTKQQIYQIILANLIGLLIQLEQIDLFIRPYPNIFPQANTKNINLGLKIPANIDKNATVQRLLWSIATLATNFTNPFLAGINPDAANIQVSFSPAGKRP